jgi:hypothetical protein
MTLRQIFVVLILAKKTVPRVRGFGEEGANVLLNMLIGEG